MTTDKQEEMFLDFILSPNQEYPKTIDRAMEWIKNNLDPEDVFTAKQLDQWANYADYVPRPSH